MTKIQKLMNELEEMAREMKKEVYVWSGSGYVLDTIDVTEYLEDRNDISIEEVAMLCLKNNVGYVISEDTFVALADELMASGYTDAETFESLGDEWVYCDLTTFDDIPKDFRICYLLIENLHCSDNIEIHS